MSFNSVFFLFIFLPVLLLLYTIVPARFRNVFLLFSGLAFYAWGAGWGVFLLVALIVYCYASGVMIQIGFRKIGLGLALVVNLGLLFIFKYSEFAANSLRDFLSVFGVGLNSHPFVLEVVAPLGISYFVFKIVSYSVDIFNGTIKAEKNIVNFALFVSFFPSVLAGPIDRYSSFSSHLKDRAIKFPVVAQGIIRFTIGLAKKVIIANSIAHIADTIFSLPLSELRTSVAWLGAISFMLQVYFDFSGYTDMAIGLGKIFGFTLMENFDYPYISRSIQEFWNRWHISLSQWFRDYVFYPLEMGKQSKVRGFLNVLMVFLLCGLWHGAAWVYVIWGAYYGVFLGIERLGLRRLLDKIGAPLGHLYALIVICFGWALFRSDTIQQAFLYWCSMLGLNQVRDNAVSVDLFVNVENVVLLVVAVLSCLPQQIIVDKFKTITHITSHTAYAIKYVATLILLILSLSYVANSTFNPFIYVKF